jgi:hypothetical protein
LLYVAIDPASIAEYLAGLSRIPKRIPAPAQEWVLPVDFSRTARRMRGHRTRVAMDTVGISVCVPARATGRPESTVAERKIDPSGGNAIAPFGHCNDHFPRYCEP